MEHENTAARLWRDRALIREQERNFAQARARILDEKVIALMAENDQLASQNAHLTDQNNRFAIELARLTAYNERLAADVAYLRAQLAPARVEPHRDVHPVSAELLTLLDELSGRSLQ